MTEIKTMVQAAHFLAEGGDHRELGNWSAKNPKKAIVLEYFFQFAKKGAKKADVGHAMEGMAELFEKAEGEVLRKILPVLERAMHEMARGEDPDHRDLIIETILEICEPVDLFVANNDLLLVEKFRVVVREALIDMGDRPAGDLTLEGVMRSAMKLIAARQVDRALKLDS